ncbi:unnamed protein product [Rhizoctonia solani]|uniref:Uncharacterized protein n=1 Tax=Rhizoctonia solani TaxID=456999 RepID=A0A8H3D6U5_9AGAM|nr:unnamed protein product [Rhizoctonia solani]
MLTTLNNSPHGLLGSAFPDYFKSYTNEALAVSLSRSEETDVRAKAAKTVNCIIALGGAPKGAGREAAKYITFSMLESIIDAIKTPEEIKRLADTRLVVGCVELMAPMESLFGYEYGYVCFRILNLAISACILKRAGRLDDTIRRMGRASDRLLVFWGDSAAEVYLDLQRTETIALKLCAAFTADVLDRLVELLHANQKQYFIVLRVLQSMGLSGLMLILRAHIQDGGIETRGNMHGGALNKSLMHLYSRLLWRYLLAVPVFIEHEAQALYEIHLHVTYWARLRDSHYIDIEDSRNLLQALNERLLSSRMIHLTGAVILLRFVEPLVVPGCEDLIPILLERSLRLVWSSILSDGADTNTARTLVGGILTSIRYILQEVHPKYLKQQEWVVELVECIINEGLTDLVLRVLAAAPDFVLGQQGATERLYDAASEFYEELRYVVPKSYLALRLKDSGVLADWRKYANHFFEIGHLPGEVPINAFVAGKR